MTTNVVATAARRSIIAVIIVCLVASVALWLRSSSSDPSARNDAQVTSGTSGSGAGQTTPTQAGTVTGHGGVISIPLVKGTSGSNGLAGSNVHKASGTSHQPGDSSVRSAGGSGAGTPGGDGNTTPARVTGLSLLLDYVNNTSGLGFPTVYQLGTSTIFAVVPVQDLPKAGQNELFKVVNVPTSTYDKLASNAPAAIAFARKLIAPLSKYNKPSNAIVGVLAKTLDELGTKYAGITGPFNQMLVGFATLIKAAKAPVPH